MKPVKLIAMDLDGTLFARGTTITPYTLETLLKAKAAGYKLAIVSGRSVYQIRRLLPAALLEALDYILGVNSAQIFITGQEEVFHRLPLPYSAIAAVQKELGILYSKNWMCKDEIYVTWPDPLSMVLAHKLSARWHLVTPARLKKMEFDRIMVFAHPSQINAAMQKNIPEIQKLRTSDILMEVFSPHLHKGKGIEWLASQEGIACKEIAAFGDDYNDLEMLQTATGIAMCSGKEAAKEAATYITTHSNREDGLARWIQTHLL